MEEIGKALKTVFDKLSDFFDIFDLSFFVSGVATTICIYWWLSLRNIRFEDYQVNTAFTVTVILMCYVNGLISFAAGRWIRMGIGGWVKSFFNKKLNRYDSFDATLIRIIKAHGLESKRFFRDYLDRTEHRGTWRLYVRLWAEVRQKKKYSSSLSFLKRYWVMAATYDGLSITLMITILLTLDCWIGVFGHRLIDTPMMGIAAIAVQVFMFLACLREADRYVEYQIEELIATISTKRGS